MYRTKLGVALLLLMIFSIPTVSAETLAPIPSPAPPVTSKPNEALNPSNLKKTGPAWVSRCVSESRKSPLVCSVEETVVLANTGQVMASVVVRTQLHTEPVMIFRVPFGLYLPAGLNIQIDNAKPEHVPLQNCDAQGCYAEIQISPTLLAALKRGKRLSIIGQNTAKNNVMLPLVLDNFADAFQKIQ